MSRTFARSLITVVALAGLAACGTQAPSSRPAAPPTTPTPGTSRSPAAPAPVLAARVQSFLTDALAGRPVAGRLLGDRLVVMAPATFSEVPASVLEGDGRAFEVTVGYGCPGVCTTPLGALWAAMDADLRQGAFAAAPTPVSQALADWPTVSFRAGERSWRVSFDETGERLLAVEVFGELLAP